MFKYFPHTANDLKEMKKVVGIKELSELFSDVPKEVFIEEKLNIPEAHSEIEIREKFEKLSSKNKVLKSFMGAGSYDVYTPSIIPALTSRQEFLTSYTPYQPEIAQGTLQYIFEFQSMICELTGMDVSNASVYDGATATSEAMFMTTSATKRNKVLVSKTLNPKVIEVLKTYGKFRNIEIVYLEEKDYKISTEELVSKLDNNVASVIVQNPNFFGVVQSFDEISALVHENQSLLIMNVDPSTLSVLKTPGEYLADIACGDAQSLGVPKNFGGPTVGFIAASNKLLRKMPGRICGMTNDSEGRRGFVLTLQAREQHIRREKANSNICSNQSLMALHTVIYMATMGKSGLVDAAKRAYSNSHYLKARLLETNLFKEVSNNSFFKEFVLEANVNLNELSKYLENHGYLNGLNLEAFGEEYKNQVLFCATETKSKVEIDEFVSLVGGYSNV